ncbi:MAG: CocE/NonD family hydrolase [Rubrobacter sp.]|nr:CocE/NonD family hydrolase [Rubrobacter sp.]
MHEILIQKNIPATMRDGIILMSNIYRPTDDGPYPVLLTRMPYGKDLPRDFTYFDPVRAVERGYIVVVQDVRGRFASEGDFDPFPQEIPDGHDSVEWAAKLPGSDGSVGMWGLSYFGKTQWHAAETRPPSLKSIVPGQTWGNHLNGASLRGGAQELGLIQYWAQASIAPGNLFRKFAGNREEIANRLPAVLATADELFAGSGYDSLPFSELPNADATLLLGLGRSVDDAAWDAVNIDGKYDRINVPSFHIGGWYDCFIGETLRQYEAMKEWGEESGTRPPRLLVGPWTHASFGNTFGGMSFGMASSGGFINANGDFTERHLRWFDATLKNDDAALESDPPVEVFVMGENRWRGFDEWPPPSLEEEWLLRSGGGLSRETPTRSGRAGGTDGAGEADEFDYDPRSPVPTVGGATLLAPIHGSGPMDQRNIEARDDVLTYTSEPFESEYTVIGAVHATLFAASSAPDTDFVVRLTDVHPDGRSITVTDGIIRASARESYPAPGMVRPTRPSPIETGRVYEYCVDLWATGVTFGVGHRMRIAVTSSSFPRWDRNLNTGESGAVSGRTEVARQSVFHDAEHPSRVTMSVVNG